MFRVYFSTPKITYHKLIKATAHTVTFRSGTREVTERKRTEDYKWYETFEEAKVALVEYWEKAVAQSIRVTEHRRGYLKEAKAVACSEEGA